MFEAHAGFDDAHGADQHALPELSAMSRRTGSCLLTAVRERLRAARGSGAAQGAGGRDPIGRSPRPRRLRVLRRLHPYCGRAMRMLAAIEDPVVARKILACLGLPARAPPLGPVAGDPRDSAHDEAPAEDDRDLDQTPSKTTRSASPGPPPRSESLPHRLPKTSQPASTQSRGPRSPPNRRRRRRVRNRGPTPPRTAPRIA